MAQKRTDDRITRLPSEFGGDVPMTNSQQKFWRKVYYGIIVTWLLMMVIIAVQ